MGFWLRFGGGSRFRFWNRFLFRVGVLEENGVVGNVIGGNGDGDYFDFLFGGYGVFVEVNRFGYS